MIKVITKLPDLKQLAAWLETKKEQLVAFDTETTGLHPIYNQVLLIQFGDEKTQFVIDVAKVYDSNFENIKAIFHLINKLEIILVAHNAVFDYKMIKGNYGVEIERIMCTMIGARLLTMGRKNLIATNLAITLRRYLGVDISKEERLSFITMKFGDDFTQEQLIYSAIDVQYLLPLLNKELTLINNRGLERVALLEFNTICVTGDMELTGATIDVDSWLALEKIALDDAEELKKELDEYLLPFVKPAEDLFSTVVLNYNSPQQLLPVLEAALGQSLEGTSEQVLKKLDNPITNKLLEYRKRRKLSGTYGSEFLKQNLDKDGRIRSSFLQLGTETGRYASKNPNLQNIPADPRYRKPFIAPKGYKFISADFSGQELRLLAYLSQEPAFLDALTLNKDLHAYSASLLYKIPYLDFFDLDRDGNIQYDKSGDPVFIPHMKKTYRNNAKSITFGLLYGMGARKLADTLKISLQEAKDMITLYFNTFPKIKTLMDKLVSDMMSKKYAISPLDGRKLFFNDLDWDDQMALAHVKNQTKNFPFQGAGASTTKQALIYIKEKIRELNLDAQILFAVHDEINVTCIEVQAEECKTMIQEQMIRAFNDFAPTVPMTVTAQIGDYWIH